jgi:hypothetical protein
MNRRSTMRRAILPGLVILLTGCAAMESAPPERLADLRAKATACSEALPDVTQHDVDRFGRVRVVARGPEADVIERNFLDCVLVRGRWAQWKAGQPAPMLEPLGTDNPDPEVGRRMP